MPKRSNPESVYTPVDCSFHDQLIELATFNRTIDIVYLNSEEQILKTDTIKDIYTAKTKEEFVVLGSGIEIRLDKIISAGNYMAPTNSTNCTV